MLTEIESLQEQANMDHAVKGAVVTGLSDILLSLTKTKLSALASAHQVAGRSKMKKEQLADAVSEQITNPDKLASILLTCSEEEQELLSSLLAKPVMQADTLSYEQYAHFLDLGLMFAFYSEDQLSLVLPDEVKAAFANLDRKTFKQDPEKQGLVYDYVLALTHLYGAYDLQRLLDIYNAQNSNRLDSEELEFILQAFGEQEQPFAKHGSYIASASLLEGGTDKLDTLLEKTGGKPHYVPSKEELLKYKDVAYYELTPEIETLQKFINPKLGSDPQRADVVIQGIHLACLVDQPVQEIVHQFEQHQIRLETLDQAQRASVLIEEVYNRTRTWANGGHTAAELNRRPGEVIRALHTTHYFPGKKQQISVTKVGRNEPCPCGSGLKYKKCHGK